MALKKILIFAGLACALLATVADGKHLAPLGNGPTLLEHKLEWATTTLSSDCSTLHLHIRYNCSSDDDYPFSSQAEFDRICEELVSEGLKRYYQNTITLGSSVNYDLQITTEITNELNQWIILRQNPDNNCVGKSFNDVVIPIIAYYCDDIQFRYTIAHEFGHGILLASLGSIHSATHKGTSTLSQVPRNDSKVANCDGSVIFDLMHYFQDYDENCLVDGIRGAPFYLSALGAEADYQALTLRALDVIQEAPGQCGLNLGSACVGDSDCLPGLVCHGDFCQECRNDVDCLADQFCLESSNPGGHLYQCLDRRPLGSECDHDAMCEEGNCDITLGECKPPNAA